MPEARAPIVVGIDESPGTDDALRWALDEARARGVGVRLLYAYGSDLTYDGVAIYGTLPMPQSDDVRVHAMQVALGIAERAATLAPDIEVNTDIVAERASTALVAASADACLVVVGSRRISTFASFVVGSVSAAVSVRAECPVVVVRGPGATATEPGAVVVGVDGRPSSQNVLAFAFAFASRHSIALHAVLCWRPDVLAEMVWRPTPPAPSQADALLSEALAGWREKYPDVTVQSGVTRIHPVDGLVAASNAQALLVVGRRGHHEMAGTLLGSVTMGVLHHATCPVAVIADVPA
jgi:nucleotide-binding universal stress UspA family protein